MESRIVVKCKHLNKNQKAFEKLANAPRHNNRGKSVITHGAFLRILKGGMKIWSSMHSLACVIRPHAEHAKKES